MVEIKNAIRVRENKLIAEQAQEQRTIVIKMKRDEAKVNCNGKELSALLEDTLQSAVCSMQPFCKPCLTWITEWQKGKKEMLDTTYRINCLIAPIWDESDALYGSEMVYIMIRSMVQGINTNMHPQEEKVENL